jgi:NadR type nicotinamide-nucleotide adenylyltransferase
LAEIKKIVVIGPESTGKSTLSADLAAALGTKWVPEYAREYLEHLGRPYVADDLLQIAAGQLTSEDDMMRHAGRFLVCDTDLNVIKVWSEHAYGHCSAWVLEQIADRSYDMYLLTDIDIPWQDDPLREHGQPEQRRYFYNIYKDIVMNSGIPWAAISGTREERLQKALASIIRLSEGK